MKPSDRIDLISKLGQFLQNSLTQDLYSNLDGISGEDYEEFKAKVEEASYANSWFIKESIETAIEAWGVELKKSKIKSWLNNYPMLAKDCPRPKKVGIVMAGNIPLVGLHDLLCVFLSGHHSICKLSSADKILLPAILDILVKLDPAVRDVIKFTTERLNNFDAIIATGSNNTSRYFEYYFGKYPHIIRKNRNSVAILSGSESKADLKSLGKDIFQYFGLGCRNVSKLYVPQNYSFTSLFEAIESYNKVQLQSKYMNNYDFNKSIYLINKVAHYDNGFCLLKEDEEMVSPISVLFFEYYENLNELYQKLETKKDQIQCIVGPESLKIDNVKFGESQKPELDDYADGIDTINFLLKL